MIENDGIGALAAEDDDLPEEIEVILPDDEDEIEEPEAPEARFEDNLADTLEPDVLTALSSDILEAFETDLKDREEWLESYKNGLEYLGLKIDERSEPWEGACGVYHPMITEAIVRFQAEMVQETLPAAGPVKTLIRGRETPETVKAAQRVADDMNDQIVNVMVEYAPEHEKAAWGLAKSGNAFKKVSYDPNLRRQASIYVPVLDLVLPIGASSLQTAQRITHITRKTPNEVKKLQVAGFYRSVELEDPVSVSDDTSTTTAAQEGSKSVDDGRHRILEVHTELELDEPMKDKDGIALPYVVHIDRASGEILAVYRNWRPDDPLRQRRTYFVHYVFVPGDDSIYGYGYVHLVGGHAKAATALTRQLVDSGTLANLPGGLKTRGLRIKGDDNPIAPGEFRDVDVPSGTIKDNIMPLPYKEPSQTLFTLLQSIADDGRRFASTADMQVSDMNGQAPVGTTLALLERQLKLLSAVQGRVHRAMKQELQLIKDIIRDHMPDTYDYMPEGAEPTVRGADYDMVDVVPVSDPNAATMSQKIAQVQAVLQADAQMPGVFNRALLARQLVTAIGMKNPEKLVPLPDDDLKPSDPVSENAAMLMGKPAKAFMHQNHEAHIAAHMALSQDPKIQAMMQQNPMAQQVGAAIMAHVMEHVAMGYRMQAQQMLGIQLPDENMVLPPDLEGQIAQAAAQAAQAITGQNQQAAAQQQAQQMAQDPLVQMQQAELALKERELQRKEADSQRDFETAQAKVALEQQRINADLAKARDKTVVDSQLKLAEMQQKAAEAERERRHQDTQNTLGRIQQNLSKPKDE